jgi:hypothetical protein
MALAIWTEKSGYSLGTINERSVVDLALPITYENTFDDSSLVTFQVITGSLPPGLRIDEDRIVGTPFEVARTTDFKFVIRASYNGQISDRTFIITIEGPDEPAWLTADGSLPIGPNDAYYILDSSYIDFQLSVIDRDTAAGQELKFFIASDDGELPPGLVLTDSGRIVGWVQPALAIGLNDGNGFFDTGLYDTVAYDFGYRSSNGYDSYVYDLSIYDFSAPSQSPKKLNRNYEFIVTVTDGDSVTKRKFRIYVVGDDFFRADNVITTSGTGVFTADITYVRAPIWVTPADLGIRRANNYQTFKLETYEDLDLGPVVYSLDTTNPDLTASRLPPGMQFDPGSAEVFGVIPYQPAITKTYRFTVTATRLSETEEVAISKRTFTVQVIGEVDSVMSWTTSEDLGSIGANYISNLSVTATSTLVESVIIYTIQSGSLPPGLTLNLDGEIVGKVNQFGSVEDPGIVTFDGGDLTFDVNETTFDKVYVFTILARDIAGYSAISQTFTLTIETPNDRLYSNIFTRPFLKQDQRTLFKSFITDADVFDITAIYRPSDPNFGVQPDLKMLVYGGIETKTAAQYVSVIGQNHKKKRFIFGDIKKAKANLPGTTDTVYEVVYIEMIDPLEKDGVYLDPATATEFSPFAITVDQTNIFYGGPYDYSIRNWGEPKPFSVSADRSDMFAGDPKTILKQPSSISLWRYRIEQLGLTERNYLPLWMRTIQDGSVQELGYTPAIPLCYCKPGRADDIILNIKNKAFDFSQIDYTIDRYIIDSVTGDNTDKYLVFRNDRTTIS